MKWDALLGQKSCQNSTRLKTLDHQQVLYPMLIFRYTIKTIIIEFDLDLNIQIYLNETIIQSFYHNSVGF